MRAVNRLQEPVCKAHIDPVPLQASVSTMGESEKPQELKASLLYVVRFS